MASNNFFVPASVTSSGRPVLVPNEVECNLLSNVDIEHDQDDAVSFPPLKSGHFILTTHRLLFLSSSCSSTAVAIPLSVITHIFSSKRSLKSVFHSPRFRFQVSATPDNRILDSDPGRVTGLRSVVITVVVRGKGDWELFLSKMWECWRGRAWETTPSETGPASASASASLYASDGLVRMVGVGGLLRKEQEMWESTDRSLQEAFQDLNALMNKAKEMVMLAEKMRQKLLAGSSSQSNSANDEELGSKEEMQDWLLSVGIVSPVTKESAGALYHQQLSRQKANVPPKVQFFAWLVALGIINTREKIQRRNPKTCLSPSCPVMLRKFDSGVMVIQSKSHSDEEVFGRLRALVTKPEALRHGISASDAAMTLGIAPAMAKEHLLTAEGKGLLCRDISPDGFRFYINLFSEIILDDLFLVKDYGIYSTWVKASSASG
ncbi:vacuolar protein sorting-associated protein 36 [Citrus sinensis]|uniref:Vacuolar protein sorting-associated protein 36 n=1 Tax=Citrus sinensis TaxID=2711 RepID=A0ACB8L7P8_CITSI|nr:vacuolar protein sorting-associated protein 36 [Citrus sinensis]